VKVQLAGGEVVQLGTTEAGLTLSLTDYSRRSTDAFGVTTVVERAFARRLSVRLGVGTDAVDALQRRLAGLRAQTATWIADDRFASLAVAGFYKDFTVDLAVPPLSYCTLTIEGLAETQPAADPGGDPAPNGKGSTLRLIQPVTITPAVLTGTNVPETDYPEWALGTSYAAGARVIKAATHRVYESAVAANLSNDPASGATQWLEVGPTNRWAMFDQALGTATSRAGGIEVSFEDTVGVGAMALLDVAASTVRVRAPAGYDRTLSAASGSTTFLDLPKTPGQIIVTITGPGQVSVGTLLMGKLVALGVTEASPTAGITDFSRKEADDFGEVTLLERAWAKRMQVRALIRTDAIDAVTGRIASVRARPSLWLADELESLNLYGFFKDASVELGEGVSVLSLTVEGLSKAAPLADPAPPPFSWSGDWEGDETYQHNEIVRFGNRLFGSKGDNNIGQQPPSSGADDDYWFLFVEGGTNGTPGAPGANGQPSYVHIAYANNATGTSGFHLTDPTGRAYIGVYTDSIEADSTDPALYNWSLIKGQDGSVAWTPTGYANVTRDGSTFTKSGTANQYDATFYSAERFSGGCAMSARSDQTDRTKIFGLNTDPTGIISNQLIDYAWFTNNGGLAGYRAANGTFVSTGAFVTTDTFTTLHKDNGTTAFITYLKNGAAVASFPVATGLSFHAQAVFQHPGGSISDVTFTPAGAHGEDGLDGAAGTPGAPGINGQTSYVHFAYADSADGTVNFTTGAPEGRFYVGVYGDFTIADSTNPAAYTWSLQRGSDGDGIPGPPGPNGETSYVHVAYANNATGTLDFHLSDPTGRTHIGVYTDFIVADSSNPALYTWSLIKGSDGTPGTPGAPGSPGTNGTNGTNGKDGIAAESTGPTSFTVACDFSGAPKAGAFAAGAGQLRIRRGGVLVTSGLSNFALAAADDLAGSIDAAGNYTFTSISDETGYVIWRFDFEGQTYFFPVTASKARDGNPANFESNNATVSGVSGGYFAAEDFDFSVPAGRTCGVGGSFNYGAQQLNSSFRGMVKITSQNLTDAGPETDLASAIGTLAILSTTNGPDGQVISDTPGEASCGATFVNNAGGTKTYRFRVYVGKNGGSGTGGGGANINAAVS
jgi:hypothetical protein